MDVLNFSVVGSKCLYVYLWLCVYIPEFGSKSIHYFVITAFMSIQMMISTCSLVCHSAISYGIGVKKIVFLISAELSSIFFPFLGEIKYLVLIYSLDMHLYTHKYKQI